MTGGTIRAENGWRIAMVLSVIVMSLVDAALPTRSILRVEIWVVVMFVDIALTILLVSPRRSRTRYAMLSWLVGCYLGVYSLSWIAGEWLFHGAVPPQVSLYPFDVVISLSLFVVMLSAAMLMLYVGKAE